MARLLVALCLLRAGAASLAELDGVISLVQHRSVYVNQQGDTFGGTLPAEPDNAGKCLKFIHNPRTGGSSIDSLNLNLPKSQRAYQTLMEGPLDRAAGSSFFPNLTSGQLFDQAHGAELSDEASGLASYLYGFYIPVLNFRFVSWPHPLDNYIQTCQDLHTPPHYDAQVEAFFSEPGCTNFCVVRDPLKRIISTYKFRSFGPCTEAGFDQWVMNTFPLTEPITFCHGYPQIEYVYNAVTKDKATKQWCHRILRLENFTQDYNSLMTEFGRPLRMTTHLFSGGCRLDVSKISTEAKDKIYNYYRADYDAFGYPKP